MNYLAYGGYWFYGASDTMEMAAIFSSYGLLTTAPTPAAGGWFGFIHYFWEFF